MTWTLSLTGHVADAATEEAIVEEVKQFIVDLMDGFDSKDVVISASFGGMHIGARQFYPEELMKASPGYKATTEELQTIVDELAESSNAESPLKEG